MRVLKSARNRPMPLNVGERLERKPDIHPFTR